MAKSINEIKAEIVAKTPELAPLMVELENAIQGIKAKAIKETEATLTEKFESEKAQAEAKATALQDLKKQGYSDEQIEILDAKGYFEAEDKTKALEDIKSKLPTILKISKEKTKDVSSIKIGSGVGKKTETDKEEKEKGKEEKTKVNNSTTDLNSLTNEFEFDLDE